MILLVVAWLTYFSKLIELRISNVGFLLFCKLHLNNVDLNVYLRKDLKIPCGEYE